MEHDTRNTFKPTCPHCGYILSDDDMHASDEDLWALPVREERTCIDCPNCDAEYWVQGSYAPQYTSAFSEEQL